MQPLYFKKQFYAIGMIVLTMFITFLYIPKSNLLHVLIFFLIFILGLTFFPSIRGFKYSRVIRHTLFFVPPLLPLLGYQLGIGKGDHILSIFLGIIFGLLLVVGNLNYIKEFLSNSPLMFVRIRKNEFYFESFKIVIAVIVEEVFFRLFIFSMLRDEIGIMIVLISSLLFVWAHYLNRWANIKFGLKSYIFQFLVGVVSGIVYYVTTSIVGCILVHLMFNGYMILALYNRTKLKKQGDLFNDYM